RHVLVVEPDETARAGIAELVGGDDAALRTFETGAQAIAALKQEHFDLAVLGLDLPDMRAFELIDALTRDPSLSELPILVYAPGSIAAADEGRLTRLAQSMVLKHVQSPERLLDEATLFLHRPIAKLSEQKRKMVEQLHESGAVLAGKRVLIVDDDIRNIFA